jgi:hypothetical protein
MNLPNADRAYIVREKVIYLLTTQAKNDKSGYFKAFGFSRENWETLHAALLVQAEQGIVAKYTKEFDYEKYEVVGALPTPDGRNPTIKSVWYIDGGRDYPRFITANPHKSNENKNV